ncbi:MAG: hypothetical protein U1E87_07930 [Alphaproteobacteria bacterium]
MKNITLSVEEEILRAARIYAAEHNTTVNALVRKHLSDLGTATRAQLEARRAQVARELGELSRNSTGRLPQGWKWSREDVYRERLSRLEHIGVRGHGSRDGGGEKGSGGGDS